MPSPRRRPLGDVYCAEIRGGGDSPARSTVDLCRVWRISPARLALVAGRRSGAQAMRGIPFRVEPGDRARRLTIGERPPCRQGIRRRRQPVLLGGARAAQIEIGGACAGHARPSVHARQAGRCPGWPADCAGPICGPVRRVAQVRKSLGGRSWAVSSCRIAAQGGGQLCRLRAATGSSAGSTRSETARDADLGAADRARGSQRARRGSQHGRHRLLCTRPALRGWSSSQPSRA